MPAVSATRASTMVTRKKQCQENRQSGPRKSPYQTECAVTNGQGDGDGGEQNKIDERASVCVWERKREREEGEKYYQCSSSLALSNFHLRILFLPSGTFSWKM